MKNLFSVCIMKLGCLKKNSGVVFILPFVFLMLACSSGQKKEMQTQTQDSIKLLSVSEDSIIRSNRLYLSDCKKLFAEAKKMDSTLLKEVDVKTDIAKKAIKAFTDFAFYCSSDSVCPVYLIKTAQVAQSINNFQQAKVVLEKCVADYPRSKDRSAALFLLAQLYDEPSALANEQEAKRIYEQIINEYPKSDWAKSSKGALTFIGKSDAQIMEELKNKK